MFSHVSSTRDLDHYEFGVENKRKREREREWNGVFIINEHRQPWLELGNIGNSSFLKGSKLELSG